LLAIFGIYSIDKYSTGLKRFINILLLISLLTLSGTTDSAAQKSGKNDTVIAKIGDDKYYLNDLKSFYEMQSLTDSYSEQDLRDFLPLFVHYQLKLKEGLNNNLHQSPELQAELNAYAKEAAYSYWIDHKLRDSLFSQFKNRFDHEIKSYHILQNLPQNPSPSDTLYAFETLLKAKKDFSEGVSLNDLNQTYSTFLQDRYAGGQLPWLTVGSVVKPFEDAIYTLEPGEISNPVRTRFGYHLIYVQEKRPRTMQRLVSHIFVRNGNSVKGEEKINQAWQSLNNGEDWDSVVLGFTEDGMSRSRSGSIGWTGYGSQYEESFIRAVFQLDTNAKYSKPVQTGYGYHIFRVDSVRKFNSGIEKELFLEEQFKNASTYKIDKKDVHRVIRKAGKFESNLSDENALRHFFSESGEADLKELSLPDSLKNRVLFQFDGKSYDSGSFFEWLLKNYPDADAERFSPSWFEEFQDFVVDSQIVPYTVKQNPEFEKQISHFRNGLIVFKISNDNVWNPVKVDTTALKKDFERNRDRYKYRDRFKYYTISAKSDSTLSMAIEYVESGVNPDSLTKLLFDKISVKTDTTGIKESEVFKELKNLAPGDFSKPFESGNRKYVYYYDTFLDSRLKSFSEALPALISNSEQKREQEFLNRLSKKYKVRIYSKKI